MGLFSHMVMYVDTYTRNLPAPEPYRSSPKGGVSAVPTAKGLSRWPERSIALAHARVLLSFNTNPYTSSFQVSQFPLFPLSHDCTFLFLSSMPLLARQKELESTACHLLTHPQPLLGLRTLCPSSCLFIPFYHPKF